MNQDLILTQADLAHLQALMQEFRHKDAMVVQQFINDRLTQQVMRQARERMPQELHDAVKRATSAANNASDPGAGGQDAASSQSSLRRRHAVPGV